MRFMLLMTVLVMAFVQNTMDADADRRGRRSRTYEEEPKCVSAYGRTACGFSCVAAYGEVQCAETSAGNCEAAYGKVECWDPAPWVFSRYRGRVPKAQCITGYGDIACGYGCESGYGEVACAGSPGGQCVAAYGEVVCSR